MGTDEPLIQIVDAALAEAARKAGAWLVCRPGCSECCFGSFAISPLDADRLRQGLRELRSTDAVRAAEVQRRSAAWAGGDDEACPALDPTSGTCDLYAFRPLTCRTFGPPVRCASGALAICELCFGGASAEEIETCIVDLDVEALACAEEKETTVAQALLAP